MDSLTMTITIQEKNISEFLLRIRKLKLFFCVLILVFGLKRKVLNVIYRKSRANNNKNEKQEKYK